MTYVELEKQEVIACIGDGLKVVICDFDTLRMMDCSDMNISAINSFISKENTKFYLGVTNE